jgi:hypothetical protein
VTGGVDWAGEHGRDGGQRSLGSQWCLGVLYTSTLGSTATSCRGSALALPTRGWE